jgi:predicted acyltransferase
MDAETPVAVARDRGLDAFRGLAVITMVAANFLADKALVPPFLKHAPDLGLTVIDLIAPMFVLAMAATFRDSYERKAGRLGPTAAAWETARRYLALIGIGAILSAGQSFALPDGGMVDWGVLQALGVAGLALLAAVGLPSIARLGLGLAIMAAYQLLLPWTATLVLARSHGGMIGAVSWAGMVIVGEAVVDLARRRFRGFLISSGAVIGLAGIALSFISPISKNRVSTSYALVSLGLSLFLLALYRFAFAKRGPRTGPVEIWGRRPLALYLAHQMALALFVLPDWPWWHEASPVWLVLAQLAFLLGGLTLLAYAMERRSVRFKL